VANSSTWTISGNKFFQTGTRTAIASAGTPFNIHRAINIITASGGGYTAKILLVMLLLTLPELLLMMGICKPVCRDRIIGRFNSVSSIQGNNINGISFQP
jgi:hypothetical protein